jgi:hypothetical protein
MGGIRQRSLPNSAPLRIGLTVLAPAAEPERRSAEEAKQRETP